MSSLFIYLSVLYKKSKKKKSYIKTLEFTRDYIYNNNRTKPLVNQLSRQSIFYLFLFYFISFPHKILGW